MNNDNNDDNLSNDLGGLAQSADLANRSLQEMSDKLSNVVATDATAEMPRGSREPKKVWSALKNGARASKAALDEAAGGVRDFARAADSSGSAMGSMGSMVDGMTAAIGELGEGGKRAARVLGAFSGAAQILLDEQVKQKEVWQNLSRAGLTGKEGMAGTERQFLQSKMDLATFQKTMVDASASLAVLSGTASGGGEDFSRVLENLTVGDMSLRRLGMLPEEMGETATTYLKITSLSSNGVRKSVEDLAEGTKHYAEQIDMISRLTGQSRDAIAKSQAADIENDQRLLALMMQNGDQSDLIRNTFSTIKEELTPAMAQGYRDLLAGTATEYSDSFMRTTGITRDQVRGWRSVGDARVAIQRGLAANQRAIAGTALVSGEAAVEGKDLARTTAFLNKDLSGQEAALKNQKDALSAKDAQTENVIQSEKNYDIIQNNWNQAMIGFLPAFADLNNDVATGFKAMSELMGNVVPGGDKIEGAYTAGKEMLGGIAASGSSLVDQARSMLGKNETTNREELTKFLNDFSGTQMRDVVGDSYAWCARYVNATLGKMGLEGTGSASAASFKNYGESVWDKSKGGDLSGVRAGDIVVVGRSGGSGSHVAFVESVDAASGKIRTVGGNQGGERAGGGAVTESSVSIDNIQAIRRAPGSDMLARSAPAQPTVVATQPSVITPDSVVADQKNNELKLAQETSRQQIESMSSVTNNTLMPPGFSKEQAQQYSQTTMNDLRVQTVDTTITPQSEITSTKPQIEQSTTPQQPQSAEPQTTEVKSPQQQQLAEPQTTEVKSPQQQLAEPQIAKVKQSTLTPGVTQPTLASQAAATSEPVSKPIVQKSTELTVPSSNYAQSSVPRPDTVMQQPEDTGTKTTTVSFADTISLLKDVSMKIDTLRRNSESQLNQLNTVKQKAKA